MSSISKASHQERVIGVVGILCSSLPCLCWEPATTLSISSSALLGLQSEAGATF